jgi:hypothetical protein
MVHRVGQSFANNFPASGADDENPHRTHPKVNRLYVIADVRTRLREFVQKPSVRNLPLPCSSVTGTSAYGRSRNRRDVDRHSGRPRAVGCSRRRGDRYHQRRCSVANAVYNAIETRVRDFPLTLDKVLPDDTEDTIA